MSELTNPLLTMGLDFVWRLEVSMIDIHSHVLPGLDDGAKDIDDAVQMLAAHAEGRVTTVFATPHIESPGEFRHSGKIIEAVKTLQDAASEKGIQIKILPGAEVFPSMHLITALNELWPVTLGPNRKYILLGLPLSAIPMDFEEVVFQIQARGITPIIAHPERLAPVQIDPGMLGSLVDRGALLQINGGSIIGKYGKAAVDTAYTLLEHNWVHFLASDMHRPSPKPSLPAAVEELSIEFDEELISAITVGNGSRVINGEPIPSAPMPYTGSKKKGSLLSRLFSGVRRQ